MTDALTYFTGLPCPKGHIAERYSSNSVCLECKKLQYTSNGRKGGSPKHPKRIEALRLKLDTFNTGDLCKHGHNSNRETKSGICIECRKTVYKDREKPKKRGYRFAHKYGITEQQYDEMFWKQKGKCLICKEFETIIDGHTKHLKQLSVDHCHTTLKIRGLLCSTCNTGLGFFKNSPILLRSAALYCEEE